MVAQRGIGLAMGDQLVMATGQTTAGAWWSRSEPALVCGASMAAELQVLLAGREAVTAGVAPLLQAPRRRGYTGSDPALIRELWIALWTTLRQQLPADAVEPDASRTVLSLPHTTPAAAADLVAEAARQAGWGEVVVVSELLALAAAQAEGSAAAGEVSVKSYDRGWEHQADWSVCMEEGTPRFSLERLTSRLVGAGEAGPAPAEEVLARGAALLAAQEGQVGAIGSALRVQLGVAQGSGQVLPLVELRPGAQVVRAFQPPPVDGALLRFVAGLQPDLAACQTVAETWVERAPADRAGEPWLLRIHCSAGLSGELILEPPGDRPPIQMPFAVRLP